MVLDWHASYVPVKTLVVRVLISNYGRAALMSINDTSKREVYSLVEMCA